MLCLPLHDSHCITCSPSPCLQCLLPLAKLTLLALLVAPAALALLYSLCFALLPWPCLLRLPHGGSRSEVVWCVVGGLVMWCMVWCIALLALQASHCLHCLLPLSMLALLALLTILDLLPLLLACRRTVVPTPCSCFSAPLSPDSQLAQQPETPPPQQESHSLLW